MSNLIPYFFGQSDDMLGLKWIHVIKGAPGLLQKLVSLLNFELLLSPMAFGLPSHQCEQWLDIFQLESHCSNNDNIDHICVIASLRCCVVMHFFASSVHAHFIIVGLQFDESRLILCKHLTSMHIVLISYKSLMTSVWFEWLNYVCQKFDVFHPGIKSGCHFCQKIWPCCIDL